MSRIVLASASPRRKELLGMLGFRFVVRPADVDESQHVGEKPEDYVRRVARSKAQAVATSLPSNEFSTAAAGPVVVAADTVVVHGGIVLGKPEDASEFEATMRRLSGADHDVTTAVVVVHAGGEESCAVTTRVRFRPLTSEQIAWYWASGEPRDKAGGYALQGLGGAFVERIDGSHTNVIGLPLPETLDLLSRAGITLPWNTTAAF